MSLEDHTCSLFPFRSFQLADIQNLNITRLNEGIINEGNNLKK